MAGRAQHRRRLVATRAVLGDLRRRPYFCRADRTRADAEAGKPAERRGGLLLAASFYRPEADRPARYRARPGACRWRGVCRGEGLGAGRGVAAANRVAAQHCAQRRPRGQHRRVDRLRAGREPARPRYPGVRAAGRHPRQSPETAGRAAGRDQRLRQRAGRRLVGQRHLRGRRDGDHPRRGQAPVHRQGQRDRGEGRRRFRALHAGGSQAAAVRQFELRLCRHTDRCGRRRHRARHDRKQRGEGHGVRHARPGRRQRLRAAGRGGGRGRAALLRHRGRADRHDRAGCHDPCAGRRARAEPRHHRDALQGRDQRCRTRRSGDRVAFGRLQHPGIAAAR